MKSPWKPMRSARKNGVILALWAGNGSPALIWWSRRYQSFLDGSYDNYGIPHQYGAEYFKCWMSLPPTTDLPAEKEATAPPEPVE